MATKSRIWVPCSIPNNNWCIRVMAATEDKVCHISHFGIAFHEENIEHWVGRHEKMREISTVPVVTTNFCTVSYSAQWGIQAF